MKRATLAILSKSADRAPLPEPIWVRVSTAAALVDMTPGALRMRFRATPPPAGVVLRLGRSVRVNRERFLRWLEPPGAQEG